jgi:glycosyltransferase involved in cell wall biosynthesis
MKILLIHEFYQSHGPSGEDSMFLAERDLLLRGGHEVVCHEVHNDSIGSSVAARVGVAAGTPWSRRSFTDVQGILKRARPEVAHFHNTFPLISPSAYRACQAAGVPVIQTLHNYRLICPGALLQRDARPCEDCVGRSLIPSVRHACYRDSRAATATAVAMLWFNRARGSYANDVDRYLVLTEFARRLFVRGGLPADRLVVRPNGLPDDPGTGDGGGGFALFAGRLSQEKGVATLVEAWRHVPELPLIIAGDGPLRGKLEAQAQHLGDRVRFIGRQPRSRVLELMQAATVVVMPSEWYEGLPVTFVEALACGAAIAASRLGALADLMEDGVNGVHFEPADPRGLAAAVIALLAQPGELRRIRARNRALFEARYSPPTALRSLEDIYRAVIASRQPAPVRPVPDEAPGLPGLAAQSPVPPDKRHEYRA